MLKLIKSLKPYSRTIVLIFILLLAQAIADLSLPDYMSQIINVGIQQNGIENVAPDAIRAGEMDRIQLFMDSGEKTTVAGDYRLLDRQTLSSADYERYVADYPVLADTPLYILTDRGQDNRATLNDIFAQPAMMVYYIESGAAASMFEQYGLPAGMDPFVVLAQLPPAQLEAVRQSAQDQLAAMPESMVTQSGISYLSGEYRAVGLDINGMQTAYIIRIGGLMLLITLAGAICSVAVGFLAARVSAGYGRDTRRNIFTRVQGYSNAEFDKFSTASLITRSTNDVQQVQLVLVMILRFVFYAPLLGIGGVIRALGQDASMTWIIAAAVAVLLAMVGVIFVIAIPKFRIIQKYVDKLNLVTREMLSGLMVIRAFNTQQTEEKKFKQANVDLTETTLFINRIMVFMMPAMMLIMNGIMLAIVWVGAHQVDAGAMQVGNMMAFMQYAILIIMAFLMVSLVFVMMPRAAVSAKRIAEVLETETSIKDPAYPQHFAGAIRGQVEFQGVGFKYPGADDYVLQGISFHTTPGQTTAIVGGTGSGKSTLIDLIPRFYDVTEGRILVDGVDIREVTQHDLRDRVGYVPQQSSLFSGTIGSNIAYGMENDQSGETQKAAQVAQIMDYIATTEKGMETEVAPGGTNLSGGQKQRVSIARALAKKPEIYIFDDSFSAIDYKTDAALRKALKEETGQATVLIVAQRINTIRHADQIIVLEDGRVVGKGKHDELMAECETYRELALSQLSQEELLR